MVEPRVFACVLLCYVISGYVSQTLPERPQGSNLTFLAFLMSPEPGVRVLCSGSIIHERFVLTAANCFYSSRGEPIDYQHKVLIANDYKDIRRLIPYPRYFLQTWTNDVGLIELAEKLVFGPLVSRMSLAQADDLHVNDVTYTTCRVTNDKKISLQEESVKIAPRRHCGSAPYYGRYITKNMVCAIKNNTWPVDSGAPLLKNGRQAGVASRQYEHRVVFTNTFRLRWWIANTVFDGHMDEYFASYML